MSYDPNSSFIQHKVIPVLDDVIDNFDFEKVHAIMEALNWTYADSEDIPTVEKLYETAADLLWRLALGDESRIATGGFVAERDYSDGIAYISLSFVAEEMDSCCDWIDNAIIMN